MARIRAVLFDIDGTLLDSNDAHAHSWLDALRGHGRSLPLELVRSKIGMGSDKLLHDLAGIDHDSREGRSITERRAALFKAHYLPDIGPFAGARVLVDRLRSRGLTCVAVTSASSAEAPALLRQAAVADLMDDVVTGDEADRTKPDADLIEIALDRLGLSPEETVFIGDTPYDVEAGNRAGVPVVALRCGGWSDDKLEGAIALYDGPADLSSRLEESPLAHGVDDDARARLFAYPRAGRSAARGA